MHNETQVHLTKNILPTSKLINRLIRYILYKRLESKNKIKYNAMRILQDINSVALPSQLFGILPFFFSKGEDDLTISKTGKAYTYMLTTIIFSSSIFFSWDVLFNSRYYKIMETVQGDTEEINQTIETLFCIISYTMIVISCTYNATKHCRTLKDIAKIDEYLEASGFQGVYKAPLLIVLLALMSFSVISVAFFYVHFKSNIDWTKQCVLMTSYALQMLFSSIFALYIRIVLKNLTRRIEFVNQKLEAFASGDNCDKENWRELSNLIEMFCKFRYITENINSVTSVGLLFYMGYAFYTVTNQSYLAFSTLTTHVEFRDKFDTMGLSVAWVVAEVITMSVICSSCDAMSSEVSNSIMYTYN